MNDKDLKNEASKTDKRKQSLYFPESMLQEIKEEAARLDRSLSWVVQRADDAVGQPFRVSTHTVHAFWGLVPLSKARLDKALASQLVGGKEVAQLKIKTKSRWSDLLLTGLTLGILAPKTVTYEGVVVGR